MSDRSTGVVTIAGTEYGLRRLVGEEELSRPYSFTLEIEAGLDVDPASLLGESAAVTLRQGDLPERRFAGVCFSVRSTNGALSEEFTTLELTLTPALSLMGLNRATKIYQDQSALDIAKEVLERELGALDRSIDDQTSGTYLAREYCVQYQESDLDFVQRMLAEEGIAYSFDFAGDAEVLVLHDANNTYVEVSHQHLRYDSSERVRIDATVNRFERANKLGTNIVTTHDWNFTGPAATGVMSFGTDEDKLFEHYDHGLGEHSTITGYDDGVHKYQEDDASQQGDRRVEAFTALRDIGRGVSSVAELAAGMKFELMDHPTVGMDGTYLITRVAHRFDSDPGRSEDLEEYRNEFFTIPFDVPFRPQRIHRKPTMRSMQTATVVGPSGEEIFTDAHGRIKVQFHWDRDGANDDHSTCFLRVRQAWAGDGWGFLWIPRIGMEVVVTFIAGDPDRPLVTGSVYNGTNTPPYALPGEKTKSTIKSNSSPGGGGFNEYRFEDKKGSEEIFIHAQKDFNERIKNCHTTQVGGSQKNEVKGSQTQDVTDWQKETIDVDQKMTVDGKRDVTVHGSYTETIDGGETRTVKGGSEEKIKAGEMRVILGTVGETVAGGETRIVKSGLLEVIVGEMKRDVHGDAKLVADAAYKKQVTGALTVTTPQRMIFDAAGGIEIEAGGPVTANGAPFVTHTTVNRTRTHQTDVNLGVLKLRFYGALAATAGTKIELVTSTATAVAGAKAEAIAAKLTILKRDIEVAGATLEACGVVLSAAAMKEYKAAMHMR